MALTQNRTSNIEKTSILRQRETWFVTNVSKNNITIKNIPSIPVIKPNQRIDLLIYTSLLIAQSSTVIGGYITKGWLLSEEYLHTHDDKSDMGHTHNLTEITDVTSSPEELTQLTDGSDADSLHTHKHNDLQNLNEGDHLHLTIDDKTNLSILTDGSNADDLHTHDGTGGASDHNELNNIQGGDDDNYYHLKKDSHDKLTDGSNADTLHTHHNKSNVNHSHNLSNITDVTATNVEINRALDGIGSTVTDINLTNLTNHTNADSLHTHSNLGAIPDHNYLNGLNDGNYKHLTASQESLLTDGNNADILHSHIQEATFTNTDITNFDGVLTSSETTSQKAFDKLDDVVGLLVPSQPSSFPSSALFVNSVGSSPLVCNGSIPDYTNGGSIGSAGNSVTRVTLSTVSSNTVQDSGPGNSGTISSIVNSSSDGSKEMTTSVNNGTYGSLVISDNKDFPIGTPGFWQSFDVGINKDSISQGWNRFQIAHSGAGDTSDVIFLRDNLTSSPTVTGEVSGTGISENSLGTPSWSSGISHYNTNGILNLTGASMTNIAGYTYYNGNILIIDDTGANIKNIETKSYSNLGITTPVATNTTSLTSLDSVTIALNGSNVHAISNIRYAGRNVNGIGSYVTISNPNILFMNGTVSGHNSGNIDEDNIYIDNSELGTSPVSINAQRIDMISGDTPNASFTGTTTNWDPSILLDNHDAAIVGGKLSHDVTNYSTGYLPVGGSNLSSHNANQYITFWFRRTPVSKFDIQITGEIAGCWIKLPNVSDSTSSENGWWDMSSAYLGSGLPGDSGGGNGSNGVAVGGTIPINSSINNQRYTCTFGTGSSSDATNNNILIRFKLTNGQEITSLSFRGDES